MFSFILQYPLSLVDSIISRFVEKQYEEVKKASTNQQESVVSKYYRAWTDEFEPIEYHDSASNFKFSFKVLFHKLKLYGVSGHLYEWFKDYLSGRCQRVVDDGVASSWANVTSGVPQGSILGAVLFALFINDLPNVLPDEISAALYADDTKVYKSIRSEADR